MKSKPSLKTYFWFKVLPTHPLCVSLEYARTASLSKKGVSNPHFFQAPWVTRNQSFGTIVDLLAQLSMRMDPNSEHIRKQW
jgi:hypothetical protein